MRYTKLGQTSLQVPVLSYGTWQFGGDWGNFDMEVAKATLCKALDLGINFRYGPDERANA